MSDSRPAECCVCDKWSVWATPRIDISDLKALPIGEGCDRCQLASLICSAIMTTHFQDFDKGSLTSGVAVTFSFESTHVGVVRIETTESWYFELIHPSICGKWRRNLIG